MKKKKPHRQRVTGIGGVFFKARDPQRMAEWYREHLGIPSEEGHADFLWREHDRPEEVGRTVWSLFPAEVDFGPAGAGFMINYRVADLDALLEQLRRAGVQIEKVETYDHGHFAWLMDPEGHRIELWEPNSLLKNSETTMPEPKRRRRAMFIEPREENDKAP